MIQDYWDFIHEVRDVFGFDMVEARAYYQEFKDVFTDGEPATVDDLHTFADVAVDLADEYFVDDEPDDVYDDRAALALREYDDDDGYDDGDYYLDAGDEMEFTADLAYEER